MKRVEAININGIVFSIDDDAYRNLGSYLDSLSEYFKHEQGGNEIIADIEIRIAELFAERPGGIAQVVTNEDVLHAIGTLGTLEDITESDSEPSGEPSVDKQKKHTKRLYRNPDQSVLGGVCAGIASWLDISVIIVRIIFIIACFYGVSILIYFVLWIVIPLAKTTAQKLEMQGQPINISNIRNIKELMPAGQETINEMGEVFRKIAMVVLRIVCIVFGIQLFLTGIGILLSCCSLLLMQDFIFLHEIEWDFFSFNELLQHILSPIPYTLLMICGSLFILLTVFACLYWGIKMIFNYKVKCRKLHFALLIIWFLTIPAMIVVSVYEAGKYKLHKEITETVELNTNDTIYLTVKEPLKLSNNPVEVYYDRSNNRFYGKPELQICKTSNGVSKLEIRKEAQGKNKLEAFRHAEDIIYEIDINDSVIALPAYFMVEPRDEWKFQQLTVILYVPENTVVIADKSFSEDKIVRRWHFGYSHY
jgi:phage shock protein PspC (stress-responsive transcriptional regulator)